MTVNFHNPVKITIIDGATEAPEFDSEEFTYQVDEEVGDDFDDDHESENVVPSCITGTFESPVCRQECFFTIRRN